MLGTMFAAMLRIRTGERSSSRGASRSRARGDQLDCDSLKSVLCAGGERHPRRRLAGMAGAVRPARRLSFLTRGAAREPPRGGKRSQINRLLEPIQTSGSRRGGIRRRAREP